jgi:hypothetical protein
VLCVVALFAVHVVLTTMACGSERGVDVSTAAVLRSRFPRAYSTASRWAAAPGSVLDSTGHVAVFVVRAIGRIRYPIRPAAKRC